MIWTEERKEQARRCLSKWHGTPHFNRIAVPGVGIDCIQLVCEVLYDPGVLPRVKFSCYSTADGMWEESHRLRDVMLRCLHSEVVDKEAMEFGDVIITKTGKRSAHCGFYTADGHIWHALGSRFVTRSDLKIWKREIVYALRVVKEGFKVSPNCISLQ